MSILERLGVLSDEVSEHYEQALDWAAEQGLTHIEARVVNGKNVASLSDEQAIEARQQAEDRGLFISAVASPLFKCALDLSRTVAGGDTFGQAEESVEEHFVKLERVIEIAKLMGTTNIRIFSFWRELDPALHTEEIVSHLKQAAYIAELAGVRLLLENEPSCNGGFADEVAAIVSKVHSPALKALWDPGNEAYGGREAFPAGYEAIKGGLGHVHLKDAYIGADGHSRCVPLGSGSVPVIEQLEALLKDGYDGLFTIETHFAPRGGTGRTGTKMSLEALKAMLSEVRKYA
ncbi:sugar phosphate isomerase/epimerase family protein [Paenibacillus sp. strain BS8-2]